MALLFQVLLGWATRHVFLLSSTLHYPQTTEIHQLIVSTQDEPALFISVLIYRPNVSRIPSRYGVGASQHGRESICQEHLKQ
jgi:hypothetical protein